MKKILKVTALTLALAVLAGCGGGDRKHPAENGKDASVSRPGMEAEQDESLVTPPDGIDPITGLSAQHPGQRPIAVMLYNEKACWPQWGLASADLLIEACTEGEDTRMMAVYEGSDAVQKAGPVGPARDLFLQLVLPYSTVPMFNGSDAYASNLLNFYSIQPIDGHYAGVSAFDFEYSRQGVYRSEHGWYAHNKSIPTALDLYGYTVEGKAPYFFSFAENSTPNNTNGQALEITYGAKRTAQLEYDGSHYLLKDRNEWQPDANQPDQPVSFDNVLVLMAKYGYKDDGVTREYQLNKGTGLYLCGGSAQQILWEKEGAAKPLHLMDADGKPLNLQPGRTYLGVWGGFEGQAMHLYGPERAEQQLPELPGPIQQPTPEQPEESGNSAAEGTTEG